MRGKEKLNCRAYVCSRSCYQLNIEGYNYKIFYGSLIISTKKEIIIGTQKIKRRE
jgi:hypothetical protein